ncbi:SGS-domain-containing protein [Saccharata proteae CBS 121410]|uniref:SGS-domain-containing protein n=1 Tax=Saccharata proteae CBS 121410 TaxID=1314787 RepID=A0A9P4I0D8_9PEZI|nr:SGS-domain-containing protein [Saccharata proteae CBS 121410]
MNQAAAGAAALSAGNYDEALNKYNEAIEQSPTAPQYYIKRSIVNQRNSPADYSAALHDAEVGLALAVQRAKRELILEAHLRRAIALFCLERYGDAQFALNVVERLNKEEKTLAVWKQKCQLKLKQLPEGDLKAEVTIKEIPDVQLPSADITSTKATAKSQAPTAAPAITQTPVDKIKHDWYQNSDNVYFTLLAKGVPKDKAGIEIAERSLSISFPTQTSSSFDYSLEPLFAEVDVAKSSYNVTPHKIEVTLKKALPGQKWSALEGAADTAAAVPSSTSSVPRPVLTGAGNAGPSYPTSSKSGPKDWDKLANDLTKKPKSSADKGKGKDAEDDRFDDDLEEGDEVNNFFKKLYASADPDTRRAMMKSYQESNGTALSTNWSEVGKGKVDTTPPDGMVARKWGE